MATQAPPTYSDAVYQAAHDEVFANPVVSGIETVLPPGVSQANLDGAVEELAQCVGKEFVFTGNNLKEYVDPYEIPESGHERKVPSGAVW